MPPNPDMTRAQTSPSVEGSEETSGAHVPLKGGTDEFTTDSAETAARNDLMRMRHESGSHDVTQEVGRLLREVFVQLRQDLRPPSTQVTASRSTPPDQPGIDTSGNENQSQDDTSMIPEVRKVDFEHFKNQFHENDGRHIIEALVAGSGLPQAVREEGLNRRKRGLSTVSTAQPRLSASSVTPREGTIRRVRIRSKSILYYLSRLADTPAILDGTRTFLYPFAPLLYLQEDMRRVLNLLEAKWTPLTRAFSQAHVDASSPERDGSPPLILLNDANDEPLKPQRDSPGFESRPTIEMTLDAGFDTPSTLEEFRTYIGFVDRDLSPLMDRYSDTSTHSVAFEDFWLLFKPGEYVAATTGPKTLVRKRFKPDGTVNNTPIEKIKPYQDLWRLYSVTLPFINPDFKPHPQTRQTFDMRESEFDPEMEDDNYFRLHCYYIDFDGSAWMSVVKTFCVPAFEGTRSLDTLPVCPLRYLENAAEIKTDLTARGKKFMRYMTDRHLHYTGWSLVHHPAGKHLVEVQRDMDKQPILCEPKYIDSPCIIDFEEALNTRPHWSPEFRPPGVHEGKWVAYIDDFEILRWSDYSRAEFKSQEIDAVQSLDAIEILQGKEAIGKDRFLASAKRRRFSRNADQTGPIPPLRDEDLILLPKRLFAYSLQERCLLALDLDLMSLIPVQKNVFEQLKIPRTTKDLIRSVVMEHFEKKKLEKGMNSGQAGLMTQDSIGGKGKGLTFLLHGVPGVGKTATAEAVALEHRKPLFILTPGEVGTQSWILGNNLRYYFRLASRWDCILLLDEADTFLSQRSKYDVERNALVSIFLQVLEYYKGILFLTTNRVGQLDEAFQSRIHLALYYPSLDQKQTEQIFKVNLQKLRDTDAMRRKCNGMPALQIDDEKILDFARRPFVNASNPFSRHRSFSQWNGRQIRNAFHMASSLAYRTMAEDVQRSSEQGKNAGELSSCSVILDNKQFQKVAETMRDFNEYFTHTRGHTDADLAFLAGDRADFWEDMTSKPPNHAQRRPGRYERPYSPWGEWDRPGPREFQGQGTGSERGFYDSGESPFRPRASFHSINPYAVRPDIQAESSSQRQDISTRERDMAFGKMSDTARSRQQVGLLETGPQASRGLDEFRSDHGYRYRDRRGEPPSRPRDSRGGPYAHGRTEHRERGDDSGDEYT